METRTRVLTVLAALLVLTSAFAGCMAGEEPPPEEDQPDEGTQDGQDGGDQQAAMTTYVKDAPTDEFNEIWLTFSSVEVHFAGGNATAYDDEAEEGDEGRWITVVNTTRSVNLLAFQEEGAKAFLGEEMVEPGKYTQIRIHVEEAWGVQTDGNVSIRVPSGTAKVVRPFVVPENGSTTQVVIDLDLDRSLKRTGGPGDSGPGQDRGGQADGNGTGDQGQGQRPQGQAEWLLTPVIGKVLVNYVSEGPRRDLPGQEPGAPDATEGTGNATAYLAGSTLDGWDSFHVAVEGYSIRSTENATNWVGILDETRTVDLLNFTENGTRAFLGAEEVPAGGYGAVRVDVGEVWGVRNGTRANVTVQNGTAVFDTSFVVSEDNATARIVAQLDLAAGLTGNATAGWTWSPVIEDVTVDHVTTGTAGDVPNTS